MSLCWVVRRVPGGRDRLRDGLQAPLSEMPLPAALSFGLLFVYFLKGYLQILPEGINPILFIRPPVIRYRIVGHRADHDFAIPTYEPEARFHLEISFVIFTHVGVGVYETIRECAPPS